MATQIIILEQTDNNRFNVAFWLTVPVARQPFYANATATSRYKDASAAEVAAIQAGQIVEQVGDFAYLSVATLANVRTALQSEWTSRQTALNNLNPWVRYGSTWDGAAWTTNGVA